MFRTLAPLALALVTLPLLALGCAAAPSDLSGIWYFVWEATGPANCSEELDENYVDGAIPAPEDPPEDPWTWTEDVERSSGSFFGQVVMLEGGGALLVVGAEVLEGARDGMDWVFAWDAFEESEAGQEHEAGYRYTESERVSVSTTLRMTVIDTAATGTMRTVQGGEQAWTETDEWDPALTDVVYSQIDSGSYLVDADGLPVENVPTAVDCQGANCVLRFITTCTTTAPFDATLTQFEAEDAYEGVQDAGQPFGLDL